MNRIHEIFKDSPTPESFAKGYLNYVGEVLSKIDTKEIAGFIQALDETRLRGGRVYFIGNGGSAATAAHFVNDLTVGTKITQKAFKTFSLSDNLPSLTAISNDVSYEDVFVIQLRAHLTKEDLVVAITASGNSPNILKAIEYANQMSVHTVGLTGFDGGKLRKIVKTPVHVPSQKGEYGPVEDAHMVLDHLVHSYFANREKAQA